MNRPTHPRHVTCRACGAGPGQPCLRNGRPFYGHHQARFDRLGLLK